MTNSSAVPPLQTTEGVWIDALASAVWPWLVQMGQDRGGLYSYEALENLIGLQYRNADRIHPEWQQLAVGDVVRLVPRGWMGLRDGMALPVAQLIEGQSIVLRQQPPQVPFDGVWSFHAAALGGPLPPAGTQPIADAAAGEVLGAELAGPVTALMTRGMLLGIKRRAEAAWQSTAKRFAGRNDRQPRISSTSDSGRRGAGRRRRPAPAPHRS